MNFLEKHLFSFAEVTQKAALACYPFIGQGDSFGADKAAVEAMRKAFQKLAMDIQIVIGEGERDQAPRLYTGEQLGDKQAPIKLDVAVDPLEGTTICAEGRQGSISVMALAPRGQLFKAPDIYMNKIACGSKAKEFLNLKDSAKNQILSVARALGKAPEDLQVGILNRTRHKKLIEEVRQTKARIRLVGDGDVALALETAYPDSSLDLLMGIGGAPEGVLASVALKCLGGGFQGQLVFNNEEERQRALEVGVKELDRVWDRDELVPSNDIIFCATGVTSGKLVAGVTKGKSCLYTHTLILTPNGKRELKVQHFLKT